MSRYVDVDSLIQKIAEAHGKGDYEANMYCAETYYGLGKWLWEDPEDYGIERCEKIIKSFPTEDVVHVVRCKDCVHSLPNDGKLVETARYCTLFLEDYNRYASVWDSDFCSSGELEEDV